MNTFQLDTLEHRSTREAENLIELAMSNISLNNLHTTPLRKNPTQFNNLIPTIIKSASEADLNSRVGDKTKSFPTTLKSTPEADLNTNRLKRLSTPELSALLPRPPP